jgi:hypothetical protein
MVLETAAQLLTSALMLLQAVSANPSLPQTARDGAQLLAQSAITKATHAIGQSAAGTGGVFCALVSDKYNYRVGEVVVFDYTSANAAKLEFIPNVVENTVFPVPERELLGTSGQYRKVAESGGYPFLAIKATGSDGRSTACSSMVHVYHDS